MNHAIHFHLPFPPLKMALLRNYRCNIIVRYICMYVCMYVILVHEGGMSFNLSLLLFQLHCVAAN